MHANKVKKPLRQSVANQPAQQKQGTAFLDNRPVALAQGKMQEAANNSLHAREAAQLQTVANAYQPPKQRQTSKVIQGAFLRNHFNLAHWKDMDDGKDYQQVGNPVGNQIKLQDKDENTFFVIVTDSKIGVASRINELNFEEDEHWSVNIYDYSGSSDELRAAYLLRDTYQGKDNDLYDETSFNGIQNALAGNSFLDYKTLDDFLKDVSKRSDWGGANGGALEDYLTRKDAAKLMEDQLVDKVDYPDLRKGAKDTPEVQAEQWDAPMVNIDAGLWTDGMGPCITIAMTATYGGKRYNALLHSMDLDADGHDVVGGITSLFDKMKELPKFNQLENKKFYIAGGNKSTTVKAEKILLELMKRKLPVEGYSITDKEKDIKLTKALLITKDGKVYYSAYNPKDHDELM